MRNLPKPEFPHGDWKHVETHGYPPEGSLFYIKGSASYTYSYWPKWKNADWYMVIVTPMEMRYQIEKRLRELI